MLEGARIPAGLIEAASADLAAACGVSEVGLACELW